MRRETGSVRPLFFWKARCLAVIIGETGYSRCNLGLAGSAKNAISPANLAVILRQPLRFKIRARNGRIFLRRSLCFMFQSAIRCSDLTQSAPLSQANEERQAPISRATEKYSVADRRGRLQSTALAFPRRSLRRPSHPGERSHNKRDRFGIPQTGSRFSFTVF